MPVLYALLFAMSLLASSSVYLIQAQQHQFHAIHVLHERLIAQVQVDNNAECKTLARLTKTLRPATRSRGPGITQTPEGAAAAPPPLLV